MTTRAPTPSSLDVICNRAKALHQAGRLVEAAAQYEAVLAANPRHFEALHLSGYLWLQSGRPDRAISFLERAARANGSVAPTHSLLGEALKAMGRDEEALARFQRAWSLQPDPATAYNIGAILGALGRVDKAIETYDRAIAMDRRFAQAWYNRGVLLQDAGRVVEALSSFDQAIVLNPSLPEPLARRGLALSALGRPREALVSYDQALALTPNDAKLHNGRGLVLNDLDQLNAAVSAFDRAIALQPALAEAHSNRGGAMRRLGRFADSLRSFDRAIAIDPSLAEAHHGRSVLLSDFGRLGEALESCDRAIQLKPGMWEAWQSRGCINLAASRFDVGWRELEWRKQGWTAEARGRFGEIGWNDVAKLGAATLLIQCEQGLGDTIQFCRYAALLTDRPGRTVMLAPPPLTTLLRANLPGVEILADGEPPPPADVVWPMMSLPLAFGTRLESIPTPAGYLAADPQRAAGFAARLGASPRPRVGIAWSGNPRHVNDRHRSLTFEALRPMLDPAVDWVCLLDRVRPTDAEAVARFGRLIDFSSDLRDFSDTAALVDALDLVVSVDTSVAHLAGAMGKPVWILLPFNGEWRWMTGRRDSPWYDSARLYRQSVPGDWGSVIDAIRRDLGADPRPWSGRC